MKTIFKCDLSGVSSKFQAVPGCGLKCVVSSLQSTLNNGRNNSRELRDFVSLVTAGSSGAFTLNGVQVEVHLFIAYNSTLKQNFFIV